MKTLINLCYLKDPQTYSMMKMGKILPSSKAITWCMLATSVNRIFTKEDMREFLFRMAITLHSMNLLENWLIKDRLMKYTVKGISHILSLDDLIMHVGLEVIDSPKNLSTRDFFMNHIGKGMQNAMLIGALKDFSVIKPEVEKENILNFSPAKSSVPELTPALLAKAEFFADDLLKFIPEAAFDERSIALIEKEMELYERQDRISSLPVFDIRKIPAEIIRQCLEIIFVPEHVNKLLAEPEEFEKSGKPLIYLGWLLANDFMILNGLDTWAREGFDFKLEDYQLEDGGYNLIETIEIYNIEELTDLLKGLFINK